MVATEVSNWSSGIGGNFPDNTGFPSGYIRLIGSSNNAPEECIELVFICDSKSERERKYKRRFEFNENFCWGVSLE